MPAPGDELDGWIGAANAALAGVALPAHETGVLHLVGEADGAELWHRVAFEGGRYAGWERTAGPPRTGIALRQAWPLQLAALRRERRGNDVLAASWVEEWDDGVAARRMRPPPLDLLELADHLPQLRVPNATFTAQHLLRGSPFGVVSHHQELRDGVEVAGAMGEVEEPDVYTDRRYLRAMRQRYGGGDLLDTFEGGRASGDWPKLAALGGLAASPEWEEFAALGIRGGIELGLLGELMITPEYKVLQTGGQTEGGQP